MLSTVLLPLDRSVLAECVLPHAAAIAAAFNARLILLHVMKAASGASGPEAVDPLDWRVLRTEAQTYLGEVQARLEAEGVVADTQISDGDAAEQIIRSVQENQVDLIIMSSHGQSGLSGWNMSSVAQKVALRAYTSIMIVRAYRPVPPELRGVRYERLLAPLDGSVRAESVLAVVTELARAHKSQLLLAHVVSRLELPGRTPPTAEDTELMDRFVERSRSEAQRYLEEVRARLGDLDVETRLLMGNQVEASLHQLAEQEEVDLVVLTAHGYTGEATWPFGSVVVSFLAYGFAPILIVQDLTREQARATHAELALQQIGRR